MRNDIGRNRFTRHSIEFYPENANRFSLTFFWWLPTHRTEGVSAALPVTIRPFDHNLGRQFDDIRVTNNAVDAVVLAGILCIRL